MSGRPALAATALLLAACIEPSRVAVVQFDVSPDGTVARCQDIVVTFASSTTARFSVTAGRKVLAAGVTHGQIETLRLVSDDLPEDARDLKLTLARPGGAQASDSASLRLDPRALAPTARIVVRGEPAPGGVVTLDGSLSTDPEGDELELSFRLLDEASGASLEGDPAPAVSLSLPDQPARVRVELVATDPGGAWDSAAVTIVSPPESVGAAPLLSIGSYFAAAGDEGRPVTVECEATDSDGDDLSVTWRQVTGRPSPATPEDDGCSATVVVPERGEISVYELAATDGNHETRARVVVTAPAARADEPPVPAIEALSRVAAFSVLSLSAEGTSDPDSRDLWYEWRVVRAPSGSLVGGDTLDGGRGRSGPQVDVPLDLPGEYELAVRAGDAVGLGPTEARVEVTALLPATPIAEDPVSDLACDGEHVAWSGDAGVGASVGSGETVAISSDPARAVALAPGGSSVYFDSEVEAGPALARASFPGGSTSTIALPTGATLINDIAVDPASGRRGDVFVATDGGTAIVDVNGGSCGEAIGCWVGTGWTGYLHRPPSLVGHSVSSVDVIDVATDESSGTTVAYLGNSAALAMLERTGTTYEDLFRQTLVDLFDDGDPQAVTALAADEAAVLAGVSGLGLVRSDQDGDCGFSPQAPRVCAPPGDGCRQPASMPAPEQIEALATDGSSLFLASGGRLYRHDLAAQGFVDVPLAGLDLSGAVAALALCGSTLYVGTDSGLWALDLTGGD